VDIQVLRVGRVTGRRKQTYIFCRSKSTVICFKKFIWFSSEKLFQRGISNKRDIKSLNWSKKWLSFECLERESLIVTEDCISYESGVCRFHWKYVWKKNLMHVRITCTCVYHNTSALLLQLLVLALDASFMTDK
jgi:hypothetical protein